MIIISEWARLKGMKVATTAVPETVYTLSMNMPRI